ncbi:hypothetical protein KCU71_g1929, partial [Aureobasidium melanogenum]
MEYPGQLQAVHDRLDPELARRINHTIRPQRDEATTERLHQDDRDTIWFAIQRRKDGKHAFEANGRFEDLLASYSLHQRAQTYPSLVSFVGETGAGKSGIISLLIKLVAKNPSAFKTPVVGTQAESNSPTSGDIHLYQEPSTAQTLSPIFFADCEGINGGDGVPTGAAGTAQQSTSTFQKLRHGLRYTFSSKGSSGRNSIVKDIYPRIMYTFSDVAVFVMTNPQVIQEVLLQMLDWASTAIDFSSNQACLPYAIIVLNKSKDRNDWSEESTREWLFKAVDEQLPGLRQSQPERWKDHLRPYQDQEEITTEKLLKRYFSKVRVFGVPEVAVERGRRKLLIDQICKLHQTILDGCAETRQAKKRRRMLVNADQMELYLAHAMKHYDSADHPTPFNFVAASFDLFPVPPDFQSTIAILGKTLLEQRPVRDPEGRQMLRTFFTSLSEPVASAIMFDAIKKGRMGEANAIYQEYESEVERAVTQILDMCWPYSPEALSSEYKAALSLDTEATLREFQNNVLAKLNVDLSKIGHLSQHLTTDASKELHSSHMKHFYAQQDARRGSLAFQDSNLGCLCCLTGTAEHSLECGHIICTDCITSYGTQLTDTLIEISKCPLHDRTTVFDATRISVIPNLAGCRVLSLDGGGVRGHTQLMILRYLDHVGGIISLDMFFGGRPLSDCLRRFPSLCKRVFTPRGKVSTITDWLTLLRYFSYRYKTTPIESALEGCLGSNYLLEDVGYELFRNKNKIKVWEAGRSSSAAPTWFKEFEHEPSGQKFVDGGLYFNNPVHVAKTEAGLIWPDNKIDVLLSIGAGKAANLEKERASDNLEARSDPNIPFWKRWAYTITGNQVWNLASIAINHMDNDLNSNRTWNLFYKERDPAERHRYIRLNTTLQGEVPELDAVDKMDVLKDATQNFWSSENQPWLIASTARKLVASTFYLSAQDSCVTEAGELVVPCEIKCRFTKHSFNGEAKHLGAWFKNRMHERSTSMQPYFRIRNEGCNYSTELFINEQVLAGMMEKQEFELGVLLDWEIPNPSQVVNITLCFGDDNLHYPISGFPRMLMKPEPASEPND